jgi:hypothetical protein
VSHFFYQRISEEGRWGLIPEQVLESAESFELVADPSKPILRRNGGSSGEAAHIMRFSDRNGKAAWVLFGTGGGVRVNGFALPAGLHLLEHRDEVVVGAENRFVFSTEVIAEVRPFEQARAGSDVVKCARCTRPLDEGQNSVQCPGCGSYFHEITEGTDSRGCYSYTSQCPRCNHSTELGGGFKWVPDDDFRREGGES